MKGMLYSLWTHGSSFSAEDLVLSSSLFAEHISNGDYVAIYASEKPSNRLILRAGPNSLQSTAVNRLEISISKSVAESMQLKHYSKVAVEKIEAKDVPSLEFVELTFRRQYIQRGTMWFFKRAMIGRPIHVKETVTLNGLQAQIMELTQRGKKLASGVVSAQTKFIFRSRSARIIWLVQISAEMWEYDHNGNLYFEKFLAKFVEPLIDRWRLLGVSHSLSVVFFSRTLHIDLDSISAPDLYHKSSMKLRSDGVRYQDHFKIVVSNASEVDKVSCMQTLKKEFWSYPALLNWNIPPGLFNSKHWHGSENHLNNTGSGQKGKYCPRRPLALPSDACNGNVLEAINTCLNLLDKHYMDRDLNRTGNCVVVISAGTGAFVVKPEISLITKQRMIDGGVGIDFISLSQPPLHDVPLFHVECRSKDMDDFYDVPYWMKVSYVDCPAYNDSSTLQTEAIYSGGTAAANTTTPNVPTLWAHNANENDHHLTAVQYGVEFSPHPFASSLKGYALMSRLTGGFSMTSNNFPPNYVHAVALPSSLKNIIRNSFMQPGNARVSVSNSRDEGSVNYRHGNNADLSSSTESSETEDISLLYDLPSHKSNRSNGPGLSPSSENNKTPGHKTVEPEGNADVANQGTWKPMVSPRSELSWSVDWGFMDVDMEGDATALLFNSNPSMYLGVSGFPDAANRVSGNYGAIEAEPEMQNMLSRTNSMNELARSSSTGSLSGTAPGGATFCRSGLLALPRVNRDRVGSSFGESSLHSGAHHHHGPAAIIDPDYDDSHQIVEDSDPHIANSLESTLSRHSVGGYGAVGSVDSHGAHMTPHRRRRLRGHEPTRQMSIVYEKEIKEDICFQLTSGDLTGTGNDDLLKLMEAYDESVFAAPLNSSESSENRSRGRTLSSSIDLPLQGAATGHSAPPGMATIPENAEIALPTKSAPLEDPPNRPRKLAGTPPTPKAPFPLGMGISRGYSFQGDNSRSARPTHKSSSSAALPGLVTNVSAASPNLGLPPHLRLAPNDLKATNLMSEHHMAGTAAGATACTPTSMSVLTGYPMVPGLQNPHSMRDSFGKLASGAVGHNIPANYSPRMPSRHSIHGHSAGADIAKAVRAAAMAASPQYPAATAMEKFYTSGGGETSRQPPVSNASNSSKTENAGAASAHFLASQGHNSLSTHTPTPTSTHTPVTGPPSVHSHELQDPPDVLRLVIETYQKGQANPFKRESIGVKSHNRMRWSQVHNAGTV
jgi:hypothetical protein